MKNIFLAIFFIFLLLSPVYRASAQSGTTTSTQTFDTTDFPQWAKDIRRWDIIAFGSFPFAMFFAGFAYDMYRWNDANGMDMSSEGRRYAPWPLTAAGAIEKTKEEFERTLLIAAGVSMTIAFTDLIIVLIKRNKERRRTEGIKTGSIEINKSIYDHDEESAVEKANLIDIFELLSAVNLNAAVDADEAPASAETFDAAETDIK